MRAWVGAKGKLSCDLPRCVSVHAHCKRCAVFTFWGINCSCITSCTEVAFKPGNIRQSTPCALTPTWSSMPPLSDWRRPLTCQRSVAVCLCVCLSVSVCVPVCVCVCFFFSRNRLTFPLLGLLGVGILWRAIGTCTGNGRSRALALLCAEEAGLWQERPAHICLLLRLLLWHVHLKCRPSSLILCPHHLHLRPCRVVQRQRLCKRPHVFRSALHSLRHAMP